MRRYSGRRRGVYISPLYVVLALVLALDLSMLGVFKYLDFFLRTVNSLAGLELPLLGITLPIGISFYTFQGMSYVIDVYRDPGAGTRSLGKLILYISFFPQLIAGPIIKYHDVSRQIDGRSLTPEQTLFGLRRFITGLGKKLLLANTAGQVADAVFALTAVQLDARLAWLGAVCYTLQIYFDFSAYSDMAIGIARMFGFTYLENFNYPFTSTSIQEFWRKWHISLSTWFKEYLYIPLGGNRKGRPRTVFNKFMIFFCCGLWHGAAWTFVVWGLIHGFFLLLEEYLPIRKLPKPVGWVYAMLVVMLAFVLFRADTFEQGLHFLSQMFVGWGPLTSDAQVLLMGQLTPLFLFTLVLGAIGSFPWLPKLKERLATLSVPAQRRADALASVACLGLLVLCLVTLAGGAYSPFIYFRF